MDSILITPDFLEGFWKNSVDIFFIKNDVYSFCKENKIKISYKHRIWKWKPPRHSFRFDPATPEQYFLNCSSMLSYDKFVKNDLEDVVRISKFNIEASSYLVEASLKECGAKFVGSSENLLALRMLV